MTCDLLRQKPKGGGSCGVPSRRARGRPSVSEFNITYVVERSLYSHLNLTQLVRPASDRTLSKAERQDLRRCLLEEDEETKRKWAATVDRCTKRVLLRIHQKSVSHKDGHQDGLVISVMCSQALWPFFRGTWRLPLSSPNFMTLLKYDSFRKTILDHRCHISMRFPCFILFFKTLRAVSP